MKELFEVMVKLEDNNFLVEYDFGSNWLDIESPNGNLISVEPILINDEDTYCYDEFFNPSYAGNSTTEMNFYIENDFTSFTLKLPNANKLYNTIVEYSK